MLWSKIQCYWQLQDRVIKTVVFLHFNNYFVSWKLILITSSFHNQKIFAHLVAINTLASRSVLKFLTSQLNLHAHAHRDFEATSIAKV